MYKIVIDGGHGGNDSGAVGPNGAQEKNVVMPIVKKIADILSNAGALVKLTRESDDVPWTDDTDLSERVRIANEWEADIFISIHANAATSPLAKGVEVWTSRGQTAADPLAESIANSLIAAFPDMVFRADMSDGDKDKEANYYVLRWTDAPAALVELAFISNPIEEELLQTPDYQTNAARAIAKGIADYAGLTLPEQATNDPTLEAIKSLQKAGIINSPDYWQTYAKPGEQVSGEYAGMLIQKMAQKIAV